jgi:UDP-4-amino-4-deoxy-L-arabinose-oxoglutarate aminotransferase
MPPQKLSSRRQTFLGFQPPAVGDEEVAAVTDAIRSGWLTTGPRAAQLEERFAEFAGA